MKRADPKLKLVGAQVTTPVYQQLVQQAHREGRSQAAIVRDALRGFLALKELNGA